MPKEFSRPQRVAAQIQRELAQLVQFELKDPRVGFVTLSAVEVSRDLGYAKVFVTTMSSDQDIKEILAGLNNAAGFLRRELGQRIKMRSVPELRFVHDASAERGAELSALIDKAISSDKNKPE